MEIFRLDREALARRAPELKGAFVGAEPFEHVVFDGLIPDAILRVVADEFPSTPTSEMDDPHQVKVGYREEARFGPMTLQVMQQLNGQVMMEFLEAVTSIDGLIPDPYLTGGGLHEIRRGGFLKIHTDFNRHNKMQVDRRLNLLIYLNEEWEDSFGGDLELWDPEMTTCVTRIRPTLGTCVLFATTSRSPHGHPEPLACPPDRARRSIAMYYYSNGLETSDEEVRTTTQWYARPDETGSPRRRLRGRDFLPPVVVSAVQRLRG